MKTRKKILAALLASTMVFGMSVTAFATPPQGQGKYPTKPDNADRADVSITNITGKPDVTLYQIASVEYGPGGVEFVDINGLQALRLVTQKHLQLTKSMKSHRD